MATGEFDIGATLRKRLQEITQKKESIAVKTEQAKEALQRLFAKSKPVRQTPDQLNEKIKQLEHKRTTTSLPLAEEKAILRQIDQIQKSKIQLEENKHQQVAIQEKKAEIESLYSDMRNMTAQIAELESAISKIDLANRLGCTTNDLESSEVEIPSEKIGEIIGKKGQKIKELEQKTGCQMDVDKNGSVHIKGNADAIQLAKKEIENITLSVEEEIRLSPEVHTFLRGNGLAPFKILRQKHDSVYIDLSKDSKIMKVRGKEDKIAAFKADLNEINVVSESITFTKRDVGVIIGKSGATIKSLTEKYGIAVEVNDGKDDSSTVELVGVSIKIAAAIKEINEMVYQNQDMETAVIVSKLFRNAFLEKSGALIKELQKEINAALDSNAIRIQFEGRENKESDLDSGSCTLLEIKSPRAVHNEAVELVKKRVEEYESKTLVVKFEPHLAPKLIGKKGETINKMKKLGSGASIEIDRVIGEVSVLAKDEATKDLVKTEIEEIIAQNQLLKIPVENSMMGLIFGSPGKELRSELGEKEVSIQQEGVDAITLRGRIESITECSSLLRDFIASNYTVEVKFEDGDANLLSRKDSILSKIEEDLGVKTYIVRSRNVVEIRGNEEKAKDASKEIEKFLFGSSDIAVIKVKLPDSIVGAMIGKGGSNLQKLEQENEGVKLNVANTTNLMTIRGPKDAAYSCYGQILKDMVNVNSNDSIKVDLDVLEKLTDKRVIRKITNDLPVHVSPTASSVKLRGNYRDVALVKAAIIEFATGVYEGTLSLISQLFQSVQDSENFRKSIEDIQSKTETEISMEPDSYLMIITGKRSNVKRAKYMLFDLLITQPTFAKVVIPKHLAKVASETKALANYSADTGCNISHDYDANVLLIQSDSLPRIIDGINAANSHIEKCGKLVSVVEITPSDAWVMKSLLTSYRSDVRDIEEKFACNVEFFKEEHMASVSTKESAQAEKGTEAINNLITKVKKENAFVEMPESSLPQFVGQSSKHLKTFAAIHSVKIERVKRSPSIHIHGSEQNVRNAATAADEWISEWEKQNPGTTFLLEKSTLDLLLDSKPDGTKRKICRDFGVKLDVSASKSAVTIRGGKTESSQSEAAEAIRAFGKLHLLETSASKVPKVVEKKMAVPHESSSSSLFRKTELPSTSSKFAEKTNVIKSEEKNTAAKPVEEVEVKSSTKLFNFLVSQDDSTPSAAIEGGYYKSTSGFKVRL